MASRSIKKGKQEWITSITVLLSAFIADADASMIQLVFSTFEHVDSQIPV